MAHDPTDGPILRITRLSPKRPTEFAFVADPETRARITARLDLLELRKLRFTGSLRPEGDADWRLDGRIGATVVQPCVVTLDPVTTRVDTEVTRRFLAEMPAPADDEVQMPEDDSTDPLPDAIDLREVAAEALALALPDYPRAGGASLGEAVYAAPGVRPLRDKELHPFAGLADLKAKLDKDGN